MSSVQGISERMRTHFDGLWSQGDVWDFESSAFEDQKFARQIALIGDRRYGRALELGCGAGAFTRRMAPLADRLLAVDVAPSAIRRAKETVSVHPGVEFRAQDIMKLDLHERGPWDLVVMSETICCLGWLYPFFSVGWLACDILAATAVGGRFLMANTLGSARSEYLLRPWLIWTYRDLFLRVGFELEREEEMQGVKNEVPYRSILSLYRKTKPSVPPDEVAPYQPAVEACEAGGGVA